MTHAGACTLSLEAERGRAGGFSCEIASRLMQVAVSVVGLIVLLPATLVLAAAIKAVSKGPVFYRGQRVGKGKRIFTIYKLRTLEVGAEERIGGRLLRDSDPFYHRLGKFLKKTKLDEIPQLLNVIKGDMDLVGPRPIRPVFLEEAERNVPGYAARFGVRPGMTGLAQLRGGYYTPIANKLRYDTLYIRKRSLRLDFYILMLTFVKLLQRWITAGSLLALLVLFVSLVPGRLLRSFSMEVLNVKFNPLLPAMLAAGAYLALHAGKSNRWLISHSAIDWPVGAFVLASFMAIPFSVSPVTAFRGLIYLCVTGFFLAFVLVNLRPDELFARRAGQLLALAGGSVALLGLGQVLFARTVHAGSTSAAGSTLGSPVAFTAYLALCFPPAICEYLLAKERRLRLLWLGATVTIIWTVVLAGSRLGVPAMLVAAGVVLVKAGKMELRRFGVVAAMVLLILLLLGGERFGARGMLADAAGEARSAVRAIQQGSLQQLLVGYGAKTITYPAAETSFAGTLPENTYLTLLFENGVAGLWLMLWMAMLVVREIAFVARDQAEDVRMRLWSFAAAICATGVTALSFNVFYNMTTQVLFWGVVGLALGVCSRYGRHDYGAVLVMRFGH